MSTATQSAEVFAPTVYGNWGRAKLWRATNGSNPAHGEATRMSTATKSAEVFALLWELRAREVSSISKNNVFQASLDPLAIVSRALQEYFAPSISLAFLMLSGRKIMRPFFVCGPPAR